MKCNDLFCLGDIDLLGCCVHAVTAEGRIRMVRESSRLEWLYDVALEVSAQKTVRQAAGRRLRKLTRKKS